MSKLSYVMGMLAAGGALSAAAGAEAVTISYAPGVTTYTYDYPVTSDAAVTPISLLGATAPQFLYGSFDNTGVGAPTGDGGLLSNAVVTGGGQSKADIGVIIGYTVGTPALGAGGVYGQFESANIMKTSTFPIADVVVGPDATTPPAGSDHYAYLIFTDDLSMGHLALADIDASGTLESISVAAPEPETWALMLAGLGVAGGALRARRRRVLTAA